MYRRKSNKKANRQKTCRNCQVDIPDTRRSDAQFCSYSCGRKFGKRLYYKRHKLYFANFAAAWNKKNRAELTKKQFEKRNPGHLYDSSVKKKGGRSKFRQALNLGYRSMFEVNFAASLKARGVEAVYEPEKLPYTLHYDYVPDFKLSNGVYLECKGKLDPDSRRKMLAVKRQHPSLDIRFVFMRASNRLRKGSKTTYAQWAESHGFKWCEGMPPKDWFK